MLQQSFLISQVGNLLNYLFVLNHVEHVLAYPGPIKEHRNRI